MNKIITISVFVLILSSCVSVPVKPSIPEGQKMDCINLGKGFQQCENDRMFCMRSISYDPFSRSLTTGGIQCTDKGE